MSRRLPWKLPALLERLPIDIAPSVLHALHSRSPLVALESTLISHGLNPPHSLALPRECNAILTDMAVTPAAIGIIHGRLKVGLTDHEIDHLAIKGYSARQPNAPRDSTPLWKVGRRELAAALVNRVDGGLTVSSTLHIASLLGIPVFSTGGIGGVHRNATSTFDISSDLKALSDTKGVVVVCAGSKSILDIGLTLEWLESLAVQVATLGEGKDWPAFYSASSGFKSPMQLSTPTSVAQTLHYGNLLSLPSSLLLGVPLPAEFHAAGAKIQASVEQAIEESIANGVSLSGKEVTPWLLGRVAELTAGLSVVSNLGLIRNNVRVGGEISLAYSKLLEESDPSLPTQQFIPSILATSPTPLAPSAPPSTIVEVAPSPLLVIGSLAVDLTLLPSTGSPMHTTVPGRISLSLGGVGNNIAFAAYSAGVEDVLLVSLVGKDSFGEVARSGLVGRGMRTEGLVVNEEAGTASCGILLDGGGELVGGVADMGIMLRLTAEQVIEQIERNSPRVVAFDGNLSVDTISGILKYCCENGIETLYEPTSNIQSLKILSALSSKPVISLLSSSTPERPTLSSQRPLLTYLTPNIHELQHLYKSFQSLADSPSSSFSSFPSSDSNAVPRALIEAGSWFENITVPSTALERAFPPFVGQEGLVQMAVPLLSFVRTIILKSGSRGVLLIQRIEGVDKVRRWKKFSESGSRRGRNGKIVICSHVDEEANRGDAVVVQYFEGRKLEEREGGNVTGAGDTLAGAMLAALVRGEKLDEAEGAEKIVDLAQRAAIATLMSNEAVGDLSEVKKLLS